MFREAEKLIKKRLDDKWFLSPIDLDNVEFNSNVKESFIRLQIDWVDVGRKSISNRSKKGQGFILVSVFVPSNTGTSKASLLADEIALIFDDYREGVLKFGVCRPQRIGDNKGWYQINILAPFTYDECL